MASAPKTPKAPKGEENEPKPKPQPAKAKPKAPKAPKTSDATERQPIRPKDEPELEAELRKFCEAVEAVGGKSRGMLSAPHVKIYRCALRKLRED